jgi:shikimate 5-dehydrogenase
MAIYARGSKRMLCKVCESVDERAPFLGAARCICFSANTVTKNGDLAAIRHSLCEVEWQKIFIYSS